MVNIQRVNRKWQDVVLGSVPIQQALFLKPLTTDALHFAKRPGENRGGSWRHEGGKGRARKVFENSLLHRLITTLKIPPIPGLARPEASWRRQLLTQPPVASISMRTSDRDWTEVEADNVGVMMEQVWALADEACGFEPVAISDWSLWSNYSYMQQHYTAASALHEMSTRPCSEYEQLGECSRKADLVS